MNGTFAPAAVSAAEVDFLDLLEKEEADFADQGGYSVVACASHHDNLTRRLPFMT